MKRIVVVACAALGCSNAGSNLGFAPSATRTVITQVFLDRDGSGSLTSPDTLYRGARVFLRPAGGGEAIQTDTTSLQGLSFFEGVSVGEYSVTIDPASVGDSLQVDLIEPDVFPLRAGDTAAVVTARLTFPQFSIRQARNQPAGKRVLIRGLVLAGVQSFRDTTSYVQDTSGQIRLTRVSLRGGLTGNSPGDSVTVLGTVSSRAGQPTLDQAIITLVGTRPAPVPFFITTAVAALASGGTLDAALVQVTGAIISDPAAVPPDFRVVGNDGSGPLTVLLDSFGGFNTSNFQPGKSMTVRGVLVPTGTGQWQLKPRNSSDATVF